jgi:hypothetical protein
VLRPAEARREAREVMSLRVPRGLATLPEPAWATKVRLGSAGLIGVSQWSLSGISTCETELAG